MKPVEKFFRALISMFRRRKIAFTGRDTFIFSDGGKKYFVYGEMQAGSKFDMIIDDGIYYIENNVKTTLSPKERNKLLAKIELELRNQGIVPLMPSSYSRV